MEADIGRFFQWSFEGMMNYNKIWIYPVIIAFLNGIIGSITSYIYYYGGWPQLLLFPLYSALGTLINLFFTLVIYFLMLISVKMFIQLYRSGEPNFDVAKEEILSNVGTYIFVGILALIISIFVITIPLALLFIVTSVYIGGGDIGKAFSLALEILSKNLVAVILLALVSIVLTVLLIWTSFLPGSSLILQPLSTFVNILILGAYTYLTLESLGSSE